MWALPTPGGGDELPRLVAQIVSDDDADDFPQGAGPLVRFLWEARWKIGALFGLDGKDDGLGSRVTSLGDGPLGAVYLAAIKPFRHLIVYPALMRWIERGWRADAREARSPEAVGSSREGDPS